MSEKSNNFALSDEFFAKACVDLEAAKYLLDGGFLEGAISRAYYAAFHAARAVLLLLGERPRTHEGTLQLFGLRVVKPGLIETKYARSFRLLFQNRQTADYTVLTSIEEQETKEMIQAADAFLKEINKLCAKIKEES